MASCLAGIAVKKIWRFIAGNIMAEGFDWNTWHNLDV